METITSVVEISPTCKPTGKHISTLFVSACNIEFVFNQVYWDFGTPDGGTLGLRSSSNTTITLSLK